MPMIAPTLKLLDSPAVPADAVGTTPTVNQKKRYRPFVGNEVLPVDDVVDPLGAGSLTPPSQTPLVPRLRRFAGH